MVTLVTDNLRFTPQQRLLSWRRNASLKLLGMPSRAGITIFRSIAILMEYSSSVWI